MPHPSRLLRRAALPLIVLLTLAWSPSASHAEDQEQAPPVSRVMVTVDVSPELAGFHGAALVATLYEYDPRLAGAAATEVDRVVVRHLGHRQGVEQMLRFAIGDKLGAPRAGRRYYISCRIYGDLGGDNYKEGKQLHYCHNEHDQLPGTVYDQADGTALTFVAR